MKIRASSSTVNSEEPVSGGCRKLAALAGGVIVLCIAWLLLEPAINAVGVWWQREHYVRTEFEILSVNRLRKKYDAYGRVVTTGEQLWINSRDFPETRAAIDGGVLHSKTKEQLQGRRLAIWYHPEQRIWIFRSLRVLPAFGNKSLPTGMATLGRVTIVCAFIIAGLWLIWLGLDKTRPRVKQRKRKARS